MHDNKQLLFVGREAELDILRKEWARTQSTKTPRYVFVQGEAGVGKTTLITRFLDEVVRNNEILVSRGECATESGENIPFTTALSMIIDQVYGKQMLLERIGEIILQVAPAWLDVLSAGRGSQLVSTFVDTIRASKNAINIKTFSQTNVNLQYANLILEIAKKQPLILYIDDLQWADNSTLDQLPYLCNFVKGVPFLFIATHRPITYPECKNCELFRNIIDTKIPRNQITQIELEKGIDAHEYARARYPGHTFPDHFLRKVQENTEGYPFFLSELFSLWETNGMIISELGEGGIQRWLLTKDEAEFVIPHQITNLLQYRWENLTEFLQSILRVAAVEGESFAAQVLMSVLNIEAGPTYTALDDHLCSQHKLIRGPIDPSLFGAELDFYKFSHRFIRDFIYNKIARGWRKIVHRQVGEALEKQCPANGRIASQLAEHFSEAGDSRKSAQYALQAARYEHQMYAWSDGESWCARGLEMLRGLPQERDVQELTLKLLQTSSTGFHQCTQYNEAEKRLQEAVLLAEAIGVNDRWLARLYLDLADIIDYCGHLDQSLLYYEKAKHLLEISSIEYGEMHVETEAGLAYIMDRKGQTEQAIQAYLGILERAKKLTQTTEVMNLQAFMYNLLGIAYGNCGMYGKAAEAFNKSIEVAERAGDITYQITPLLNLADDGAKRGVYQESLRMAARGLELANRLGDQDNIAYARATRGSIFLKLGEILQAKSELFEALRLFKLIGSEWNNSDVCADIAIALLRQGNLDEAHKYALEAMDYAGKVNYELELGYALDALAQVEAEKGQFEQAEKHYCEAIEIQNRGNYRYFKALSLRNLAALLRKLKKDTEADLLEREADEIMQQLGLR